MSKFNYRARDKQGSLVQGEIEAGSKQEAVQILSNRELIPVSFEEKSSVFDLSGMVLELHKVRPRDLAILFRQLSVMISAGLPFYESLKSIEEQSSSSTLKRVVAELRKDIESGSSFSQALSNHPLVFSKLIVAMVEAGERGGVLGEVLRRVSLSLDKDSQFQQKVKTALRYPIIVVSVMILAMIVAVTFIIPKFATMFKSFGTQLPLPTRMLLMVNRIVVNYWWAVLVFIFIIYFIFRKVLDTESGKRQWDGFLLRIPVFGDLRKKLSLSSFFRMFSDLLSSGIHMSSALDLTANTADNMIISQTIAKIKKQVVEGSSLSESMKQSGMFPSISVHLVALGEKSGMLSEMLQKNAEYFDEETDYVISNMLTLIEPFIILILACMVLILALGVFMPSWNLMNVYFK